MDPKGRNLGYQELYKQISPILGMCSSSPDPIVLFGFTGSGKSTLASALAADIEYLIEGVEVENKEGKNEPFTRGDSMESVTAIPKIYVSSTGVAYCDTPGIDENRGASLELKSAIALYVFSKSVKTIRSIIVVITGSSLCTVRGNRFIDLLGTVGAYIKPEHRRSVAKSSIAIVITKKDMIPILTSVDSLRHMRRILNFLRKHKELDEKKSCALEILEGIFDNEEHSVYIPDITQRNSIRTLEKNLLKKNGFPSNYLDFGCGSESLRGLRESMEKLATQYVTDANSLVNLDVQKKNTEIKLIKLDADIRRVKAAERDGMEKNTSIESGLSQLESKIKEISEEISKSNQIRVEAQNKIDHIDSLRGLIHLKDIEYEHKAQTETHYVEHRIPSGKRYMLFGPQQYDTWNATHVRPKKGSTATILKIESDYPVVVESEKIEGQIVLKERNISHGFLQVLEFPLGSDSKFSARIMIAEKYLGKNIEKMKEAKKNLWKADQELQVLSVQLSRMVSERSLLVSNRKEINSHLNSLGSNISELFESRKAMQNLVGVLAPKFESVYKRMDTDALIYKDLFRTLSLLNFESREIASFLELYSRSELQMFKNQNPRDGIKIGLPGLQMDYMIGAGKCGTVYRARYKNQDVAVKKISKSTFIHNILESSTAKTERDFVAANLSHPSLVQILGCYDKDPSYLYVIMEYCEMDYGEWLDENCPDLDLEEIEVCSNVHIFFKQLLEGLAYLHSNNISHQDVKPANIFVTETGIKLGDFGLTEAQQTGINPLTGTPLYIAPEKINKTKSGRKSDIWSAGVVYLQSLLPTFFKFIDKYNATDERVNDLRYQIMEEKGIPESSKQILLSIFVPYDQRPTAAELLRSYVFTSSGVIPKKRW